MATTVAQVFDLLSGASTVDSLTAVRIVGSLTFMYSPNSTPADSLAIVDVGMGVSSVEAFAVGASALPDPTTDGALTEYPPRGWLYLDTQPVSRIAETEGVIDHQATFTFDFRAMRKIDKGRLFVIMEQNGIIATGTLRVIGRVRTLCLT